MACGGVNSGVGGATVTSGAATIDTANSGVNANNPHEYVVTLTNVANAQRVTVTLNNVADALGKPEHGLPKAAAPGNEAVAKVKKVKQEEQPPVVTAPPVPDHLSPPPNAQPFTTPLPDEGVVV